MKLNQSINQDKSELNSLRVVILRYESNNILTYNFMFIYV